MRSHRDRRRACVARGLATVALLCLDQARAAPPWPAGGDPATATAPQSSQSYPDTPGHRAFAEGLRLLGASKHEGAGAQFDVALAEALATGNRTLEAGSHHGLGASAAGQGRHAVALEHHRQSLDLFLGLGDEANAARGYQDVGTSLYWLGRRDEARIAWSEALARFTSLGNLAQQASLLYNLAFVTPNVAERRALIDRALSAAREAGDRRQEGQLIASRADEAFGLGDYQQAFQDINEALAIFVALGETGRSQLPRTYTSLGRLYRAHAQFEQAIAAYESALAIQRERGDRQGQAQSMRAIAIAYEGLGRQALRHQFLEQSLEAIRATDASDAVRFAEVHLASYLLDAGDVPGAFRLLGDVASTDYGQQSEWAQNTLARAYLAEGRHEAALEAATRAIALARKADQAERLFYGLEVRARVLMALGRFAEAAVDTREALDVIERLRRNLVPHDYMKRGFMDRFQAMFGLALESLDRLGRPADAMEVAERGRARAFSDLLLARQVSRRPEPLPARPIAASGAPSPVGTAGHEEPLTRGGSAGVTPVNADDLPSDAVAPPATLIEMRRQARALDSWILGYWVDRAATWAWVMRPDGDVRSTRIAAGEEELRDLVARVWRRATPPASRGSTPGGRDGSPRAATHAGATRELHRLLIASLPHAPPAGSRILVIPHGPLSALSFAALEDARGRYLVEDHAIAYVPSASALALIRSSAGSSAGEPYLLLGAPARFPAPLGDEALGPLPGARRELSAVAAAVGPSRTRMFTGVAASESGLRAALGDARVLHLATHGVMLDSAPLDSYLALDATTKAGDTANDGRLTAREVYDLDLHARLVVLSACRSGLGRASGDGLFGLARAFFYAGAETVVATLWDVADEPSARLMPRFHELVTTGASAADALRSAQLALLSDLRAGRVVVQGRRGPVPLPEHPSLWAGFVLIGNPD